MFPELTASMNVGSVILIILMSFGGFFIDVNSIPWFFKWVDDVSMFKYAWEAATVYETQDIENIEAIWKRLGLKKQLDVDVAALVGMVLFYRVATYVILRFTQGTLVI